MLTVFKVFHKGIFKFRFIHSIHSNPYYYMITLSFSNKILDNIIICYIK